MSFKLSDSMLNIVKTNINAAAMFADGSPLQSRKGSFLTKNEKSFAEDSQQRVSQVQGKPTLMETLQISSPALPVVSVNLNFGPQIETRDVPQLFTTTPAFASDLTAEKQNYT